MSDYGPPPPDGQPYDPNAQPGTPPGYGPPGMPHPPMPRQSVFAGLGTKLGNRISRRPEPRFAVSIVIWLASYFLVPGARGRSLYVFLVAYYFYSYVLFKSAKSDIGLRISSNSSGLKFHGFGTIAAVSLIFGLGYYLIALLLDRLG